ncbi:MAG: C-terminal helicase domain-containing protein, partial [Thermodesulfobacteriota bacterium]
NPGNRKVLVFTAFADTANYLYDELAPWAKRTLKIHSALVTGRTGDNRSTMTGLRKDLSAILTSFSPISKERNKIDETLSEEIDLLIATDCISEGQNLQDCDFLVNYDIHWNPVRIIQRFGRIDRLGSRNKSIQLVNFWPNMELDEYINLEARVSGRMVLLDISATGEENVIEFGNTEQMNDLAYRRRQLEQLQNEVVNIEDLSNGISITDLTLNDFRMDLADYLKENADTLETMFSGAFAVVQNSEREEIQPGVIFCLKNVVDGDQTGSGNPLAPYHLVYVTDAGEVFLNFTQAKKVLDLFKRLAIGRSAPDAAGMAAFNRMTKNGSDMSRWRDLLAKAVAAITGKAEEKGVESLFQRGGTALSRDSFRGIDDFEVISYLIILGKAAA